MSLTVFILRNFVADSLQARWNFTHDGKRPFCVFEPPGEVLRGNEDAHIRLIGKRVVNLLLVLIEPLNTKCYG